MRKRIVGIIDFRLWFIVLSYLFMFGKQVLAALIGRTVYDGSSIFRSMYSVEIMYKASLYALLAIHAIFTGLFFSGKKTVLHAELKEEPAGHILKRSEGVQDYLRIPVRL